MKGKILCHENKPEFQIKRKVRHITKFDNDNAFKR